MSVCIPCLRSSPARGPGQKRARRIRTASPLPEPTGAGSLPPRRCAGHESRRPMGAVSSRCSEAGEGRCRCSLRPRRTPRPDIRISFVRRRPRFSHPIPDAGGLTRGHPGIELRRRPPLDPLRSDSVPKPRVLATGEISPASFPVSAAGWPTRRTACAFSPAVSISRCRSGGVARRRRAVRARLRSRSLGWVVMAPSSTQGEALQGNHEESHRLDVATVGVRGVLDREAVHEILDDADRLLATEAALRLPERAVPLPTARRSPHVRVGRALPTGHHRLASDTAHVDHRATGPSRHPAHPTGPGSRGCRLDPPNLRLLAHLADHATALRCGRAA